MRFTLALLFATALLQASVPYTLTPIIPGWINISWHTSLATNSFKIYRDDRLSQTSPVPADSDIVWTFNAYAGEQITIVEYGPALNEVRRFTTDPVPPIVGNDPTFYVPLMLR